MAKIYVYWRGRRVAVLTKRKKSVSLYTYNEISEICNAILLQISMLVYSNDFISFIIALIQSWYFQFQRFVGRK